MLPVGAYSYSQGLEWAIEAGDVTEINSAERWMSEVMGIYHGQFDLPIIKRLYQAWQLGQEK